MPQFSWKGKKIIAWWLLLIQLFSPLLFFSTSIANAVENAEMADTISGIQSLMNDAKEHDNIVTKESLTSSSQGETSLFPSERLSSGHYPLEMPPSLEIKANSTETINPILPNLGGAETSAEDNTDQALASIASQVGNILANRNAVDASIGYAKNIGEGLVNQRLNDWLSQYGTARVSISSDRTFTGDFLLPVIDSINSLLFTQLGLRTNKDRNTLNLGLGYRQYWGDWMYGINTFYDYDYTGGNARLGLGGEAWTDYLKLAANGYFGLTDWHQSKIFIMDDYDERPATGFDVRAEAYLPTYPKLGGSIKYEKYFGKGVHLGTGVDPDKLKDDPYALTLGINYTPVPLITLKGEHAAGDRNDTMVGMDIIYRFGVPLAQQLDPDAVDVMRSLVGNKYDFVDRNYDIVMQYRKQELINISLPAEMRAEAKETVIVSATINKTKYGLKTINWTVPANFLANGGNYKVISPTQLEIILPAYVYKTQSNAAQEYQISAVGIDNNDNESNRATTIIRVKPSKNVVNDLIVEPNATLPANNQDRFTTTAVITNEHGQPLPQQVITFHVDGLKQSDGQSGTKLFSGTQSASNGKGITATTDSQGKAVIYITSKVAGEGKITATMENGNYKHSALKFSADRNSAEVAKLTVTRDKALADGKEKNTLYALVTDKHGNTVADMPIILTATDGAIIDNSGSANTNQRGELIIGVTSTKAGKSEITAAVNGKEEKQSVTFVTGRPSAEKSLLTAQPATIVANGKAVANLKLELKDAQGNPISGDKVTFSTSLANSHINNINETAKGVYSAELTGTTAGQSTFGVKIIGSVLKVKPVTVLLEADRDTMSIKKGNLIILKDNQLADGKAQNQLKAVVTDANGNLVPNVSVVFKADNGAMPASKNVDTNANGEAKFEITNKTAVGSTITASINNSTQQQKVNFVADTSTAVITDSNLLITSDNAPANGIATNGATAKVTDEHGNLVPNVDVAFTVSNGALINTVIGRTGNDGQAKATVTSRKAGAYTVTAKVNNKATHKQTTFIADEKTAQITAGNLLINPNNSPADGKTANVVTAIVTDAEGNQVPNIEVTFAVSGEAKLTQQKVKTDSEGKAITEITSSKAGVYMVTASVNGKGTDKQTTFKADGTTAKITDANLVIKPDNSPANGVATNGVTAIVTDAKDNPVPDTEVTFMVSEGAAISPLKVKTDANGKVKATITSNKAGTYTVTASVNGKGTDKQTTFKADGTTAEITAANLVIQPDNSPANGVATNGVTAIVTDAKGNPVPNTEVIFKVSDDAAISPVKAKTDTKGIVKATITSNKAGTYTVTASVNGKGTDKQTTFKADGTTAEITDANLVIQPDNSPADGKTANVVTARVTDAKGNWVPNTEVTFAVSGEATIKQQKVKTDSEGKAITEITSSKAGTYTVTATVNGKGTDKQTTFKADGTTAEITDANLLIDPDNSPADGKTTNVVTARVTDAKGNWVPDAEVTFTVSGEAKLTQQKVKTDSEGKAITKVTSSKAGAYTVTAKVNDKEVNKPTHFVADSTTAALTQVRLDGDIISKAANGKDTFTFIAVVKDANGNLVPNIEVTWQQDKGSDATLPKPAKSKTDANGEAKIDLTSTTKAVENIQVSAQLSDGKVNKADKTVSFVGDTATAGIQITSLMQKNIVPADDQSEYPFEISVTDSNGNVLKDYAVDVLIPALSINEKLTTDNLGKVKFSPKSAKVGRFDVTVTSSTNQTVSNKFKVEYTITMLSSAN
ncbi:Ig-like domain-containing protein [Arsenophonus apicola]|uniref:Ig-like domain-containing protein n=1 Tax=Arsenophonus apicola TaxID=2879119 RepID=UPI0038797068